VNRRARGIAVARIRFSIARQRGYEVAAACRIWQYRGEWLVARPGARGYCAGASVAAAVATVAETEEFGAD